MDKVKKEVEQKINEMLQQGIRTENIETLGELVDIHKDIANEEYWEAKKEVMDMNYREYGNEGYGARRRDSRGRYMARGRTYRGEEMIDEMQEKYQNYSEGREEYNRGNYSAKSDTLKSLEYMMQSVVDFIEMLKQDANSQEEIHMIQKYTRQISEM